LSSWKDCKLFWRQKTRGEFQSLIKTVNGCGGSDLGNGDSHKITFAIIHVHNICRYLQCHKGCDSCKNPRFVSCQLDMWKRGVIAGNTRKGGKSGTYIGFTSAADDEQELYGGGRRGYEVK